MSTTLQQHRTPGFALRALLILLLALTSTDASAAWQLCLGAEGHIEIERRGACEGAEHLPSTESDADECDPCHDILLDVNSDVALRANRPSVRSQVAAELAAIARTMTIADLPTVCQRALLSSETRFDAGAPSDIRTIVLLI